MCVVIINCYYTGDYYSDCSTRIEVNCPGISLFGQSVRRKGVRQPGLVNGKVGS